MKKMYLILAIGFAFISCNCQKKTVEGGPSATKDVAQESLSATKETDDEAGLPKLEYEANTRGFFQKITIENKMVTVSFDRNNPNKGTTTTLSDADVNELMRLYRLVKLDALSTYKDPTQKRFYDGAAIASLKITSNGKEYKTVDFDHGFPPVEIEKFVNKIASFGRKE